MSISLDILSMAQEVARYADQRHALIAENIANADTPGYKTRDLPPFERVFSQGEASLSLRTTRPDHIASANQDFVHETIRESGLEASPNGNNVSLEHEMIKAAETRQNYDMALGVYFKSLEILRASLGR
ncbi:MAG: FlgB family protein [Paracoccaceae bacterium]|nr:FlgB family protein [Paracoccaceae bacterium]